MATRTVLGILVAGALLVSGCERFSTGPDACQPVDPGTGCFDSTREAFIEHALASARARPELDGLEIEAGEVLYGLDEAAVQPTWIVPLRSNGRVVGATRFATFRDQVRLVEVALYQPARDSFPSRGPGQNLVIFIAPCGDPIPETCLFREYGWRIETST